MTKFVFMNLEKNIIDLLYKYDCVIVPEFGGFIAQKKSAVFHPMDYTFDPPKKVVGFNSDLIHSDGLLAQSIAKQNSLSYDEAAQAINEIVTAWSKTLEAGKVLDLEGLGSFQTKQSHIEFTPSPHLNFSLASFGMYPVKGQYILRQSENQSTTSHKVVNSWTSYAAAIGFSVMMGATAFFANDNLIQPQLSSVFPLLHNSYGVSQTPNEEVPAAPVIDITSLDSASNDSNLDTEPTKFTTNNTETLTDLDYSHDAEELDLSVKKYQIIGGSFKVYSKAMEHQAYLRNKGYNRAVIIGKVGNFYMVAFDTFEDAQEAIAYKRTLEKKGFDVFMRP